MIIYTFPSNCVLLEWGEQQQTFWLNDVSYGKPDKPINKNGINVVYACRNKKEAHLLINYLEKYIININGGKNKRLLTTSQINRHAKAIVKISNALSKIDK